MSRWVLAAVLAALTAGLVWMTRVPEAPEKRYAIALKLLRNGDFDRAAEEAAQSDRRADSAEWRSRFRLLQAEALIESGQGERAVALVDSLNQSDSTDNYVRVRVIRARRLIGKADFEAARELLTQARQVVSERNRTDLRIEVELLLGQICGRQRRLPEAEAFFISAREAAVSQGDHFRVAAAINSLGMIQMLRSHCDEAIPLFDQAQKLYREAGANHFVAATRSNIGLCYSQLGDLDNAFTYRQAALELSRPSGVKANALGETGTVLLADDPARAVPLYRQARDMARQFGAMPDAARWAGNLASALSATGDWDGAESALHEARQLGAEPRSRVFLDLTAASVALGRGRAGEARAVYQRAIESAPDNPAVLWQAHAGIASTWVAENRPDEAARSFDAAIGVVENAQSDLKGNEHKLTFLNRLIRLYQDYVELLMSRGETIQALSVADRSRARILSERITRKIGRTDARSAEQFRSIAKTSGSVWLSYWIAPRQSFLWVVTPTEIRAFSLPGEAEVAILVKEYRAFVETGMRDPLQTPSEAGQKLYRTLIAHAKPMLPNGAQVTIIPDGPLHQLSFDTLPVSDDAGRRYFMDDAIVAITPSFGVFRGRRSVAIPGNDALIIGDPVSPAPDWPALQYAGREIIGVARSMNSPKTLVITGEAARPARWKESDPGQFSAIHIAAHAESNERSPLDSAIILSAGSGYRLYARDIIDIPLRADLVSLSACRSSGARTYKGEGSVGFAWAFLHAGARSVVAGLWDVADESSAILMDKMYARLAAGDSPATALRKARISVRQSAYAKPFYWGAFQLYTR